MRTTHILALGLAIAAAAVVAPFVGWIILALWLSGFARGLHERLIQRFHGRVHVAALVTVIIMLLVLVPVGAIVTSMIIDTISLATKLAESDEAHSALVSLSSQKAPPRPDASVGELLLMQGDRAWSIAREVLGATVAFVVGLVVLVVGIYAFLVEGKSWWAWAEENAPIDRAVMRRYGAAFVETGRGLAYGIVGSGVLQALVATIAYMVLGVPQALALGLLTLILSVVPLFGTALVWGPVAVGLALSGRMYAAAGLALFGMLVIGSIDNIARPWLASRGKLQLPTFMVLVAMFGAVELFGGWGIIFGPLILRLAKEAIDVRREAVQA